MNIDLNEVLPQFCPECGAGIEGDGVIRPGHGILCRLPKGFPANPPCNECDRRDSVRAFQAGFKAGYEREKAIIDALIGG